MTLTTIANDNTDTRTDEEVLADVIKLLETRISVETGFVPDDNGNFTHQVLQIRCGEFATTSHPEPLGTSLRVATAEETGETVQ